MTYNNECIGCPNRFVACSDCVLSVLVSAEGPARSTITPDEADALSVLAAAGLVPPLNSGRGRVLAPCA